jgi:CheY-like chemotaxis protein
MAVTVLLVDDDIEFRKLAAQLIRGLGLVVVEAGTVACALTVATDVRPAAALVDIDLPDGDGSMLAVRLAGLNWGPRIVLTSADADAVDEADVRRSGAVAFLPKADLPDGLTRRLLDGA